MTEHRNSLFAAGSSFIVAINGGSSSLKFAVFRSGHTEGSPRVVSGAFEALGTSNSRLKVRWAAEPASVNSPVEVANLRSAASKLIDWLSEHFGLEAIAAVGHRMVHGANRFVAPEFVSRPMLDELRELIPMDPNHLPGQIAIVEAFLDLNPNLRQIACFDTAFHRDLPRDAQIVPIPRRYEAKGVRRYGFHGISYAYLMDQLAIVAGKEAAAGRIVLAHLGSGSSLAAVRNGKCVETTMGFTPCSGIVMSTRTGDLDPGVISYLARSEGMTLDDIEKMVAHESGLLGVSETSPDIRDLFANQEHDPRAAEAASLFCYRIRLAIGSLAAALGGVETLVFSGGIGENSPQVRHRSLRGLEFLGIQIDEASNAINAPVISAKGSSVAVRVIPTDEELMISRDVARLIHEP